MSPLMWAVGLKFLRVEAQRFQDSRWAKLTHLSANSKYRAFLQFCTEFDIFALPVDGETLSLYTVWLFLWRVTMVNSCRQYLSMVRTIHLEQGLTYHTPMTYPWLKYTLDSCQRDLAVPTRSKDPVTAEMLRNLVYTIPQTGYLPHIKTRLVVLKAASVECAKVTDDSRWCTPQFWRSFCITLAVY